MQGIGSFFEWMKLYTFATHSLSNTLLFYNIVQNQLVQISCSYEYGKLNFGDIQSLFVDHNLCLLAVLNIILWFQNPF